MYIECPLPYHIDFLSTCTVILLSLAVLCAPRLLPHGMPSSSPTIHTTYQWRLDAIMSAQKVGVFPHI